METLEYVLTYGTLIVLLTGLVLIGQYMWRGV